MNDTAAAVPPGRRSSQLRELVPHPLRTVDRSSCEELGDAYFKRLRVRAWVGLVSDGDALPRRHVSLSPNFNTTATAARGLVHRLEATGDASNSRPRTTKSSPSIRRIKESARASFRDLSIHKLRAFRRELIWRGVLGDRSHGFETVAPDGTVHGGGVSTAAFANHSERMKPELLRGSGLSHDAFIIGFAGAWRAVHRVD